LNLKRKEEDRSVLLFLGEGPVSHGLDVGNRLICEKRDLT
jgi:hypothetical protein